jgi:rhamnulokinase
MAEKVYLAVDLGAESGRVMAGIWNGNKLRLEEINRFPNGGVYLGQTFRWDVIRLWAEIQNGLALANKKFGKKIVSVGADTWGVDFVLLNKQDEILGQPYHYRDARTRGALERTFKKVPRSEIFAQTGSQFMELNSLYQLLAWKDQSPAILDAADTLLFMPDFFHWAMCGAKKVEEVGVFEKLRCHVRVDGGHGEGEVALGATGTEMEAVLDLDFQDAFTQADLDCEKAIIEILKKHKNILMYFKRARK